MRVDRPDLRSIAAVEPVESARSVSAPGAASRVKSPGVVVAPSALSLHAASGRSDAARAARLSAVRAALVDGSYQVDFKALAERIADEELARGGAK
jgi:anti-sigma28 factor (negative regulator of flagellin synthesis)